MVRTQAGRVYDDITQTIGGTPLVRLSRIAARADVRAEILGKLECFNPTQSVKDRIALAMIDGLVAQGLLKPGGTVIEPTVGNTGIGLASVCAARGYRLILVMPDIVMEERRRRMLLLGAELVLTDPGQGMRGAMARAAELLATTPGAVMPGQFGNQENPDMHARTTAEEILRDTGGAIDMFIAGVGSGGTLTGVGRVLRARSPETRIVAVEPEDSPILSGGEAGAHMLFGLGAGFVPDVLDVALIDRVVTIANATALETAHRLAMLEGISAGISSGAAVAAALELAAEPGMDGKRIVVILPSLADRHSANTLLDGF